jgi:serine/threonine protein kinase
MAESRNFTDRVGQQVGDYRLLRLLGGGGFGQVYMAEHVRNHSLAAVKILQARLTRSEDLKAFINEARTFRLKHPNIVPLLDFGVTDNDVPYLVMEYASRGTLRERHPMGTQVPLPTVISYVNQVASALQYAHDLYLIHRDVKPENMLVGANGDIMLTDFGIATVAHNSYTLPKNQQENIGGTVSYMAPEQLEGKPRPASDQYALGILTYEWLSGRRPFQGTPMEVMMQHMAAQPVSLSQRIPMVNPEVEQVVFTALAKDPRQRFGSIQAFATALTEVSHLRQSFPLPTPSSPHSVLPLPSMATMAEEANAAAFGMSSYTEPVSHTPSSPRESTPSSPRVRQTTRPQPPRRKGLSWGGSILLVILVLLISGGAALAYISLKGYKAQTHVGTATPKPTAAPTLAVTPTPPDLNTDPSGFYNWVTSKQPANVQSFADTTQGWDTNSGCGVVNGNYQASAQSSAGSVILTSCLAQQTNYTDFIYQVDLTMTRSETAGLIFRNNSVLNADYLFEVNSDNTYFLNSSTPSLSAQNALIPQRSFSGQTTNPLTLTVIARGHDIYLFINRHFLAHVSDATSGSGQIGLFVDAHPTDQGGAIATFSNLKVWTLS